MKKEIILIIGIILILIAGLFYWFQIRPSQIRKTCHKEAIELASLEEGFDDATAYYDTWFEVCLNREGL